jgi:hypothetical protein
VTVKRPAYRTYVVERAVDAPRVAVWDALVRWAGDDGLGASRMRRVGDADVVERTISFEPPWRRVVDATEGAPLRLYQATAAVRDDGDASLLVWAYVADPGEEPHASADEFLEHAQQALRRAADEVADLAEREP